MASQVERDCLSVKAGLMADAQMRSPRAYGWDTDKESLDEAALVRLCDDAFDTVKGYARVPTLRIARGLEPGCDPIKSLVADITAMTTKSHVVSRFSGTATELCKAMAACMEARVAAFFPARQIWVLDLLAVPRAYCVAVLRQTMFMARATDSPTPIMAEDMTRVAHWSRAARSALAVNFSSAIVLRLFWGNVQPSKLAAESIEKGMPFFHQVGESSYAGLHRLVHKTLFLFFDSLFAQ